MLGRGSRPQLAPVLFTTAFFISTCGLVYELVAGAMASYLLGDSVTQFSLIIGVYLSSMGLGAYLSRFVERHLLERFIEIEVAVALVGGFEAVLLFYAFAFDAAFRPALYGYVLLIGTLVGLELPLLLRILEDHAPLKELLARVLFLDYVGALVASVAFPLLLVPSLGLFRTAFFFGLLNAVIALWSTFLFAESTPRVRRLRVISAGSAVLLALGFAGSGEIERRLDGHLYADPLVYRQVTPYQQIAVTRGQGETRLYLNGALQFSSGDEYRYHESLVHPAMAAHPMPRRVLVLGGGDGLAAREALRYASVETLVLVDLDPGVTRLFTNRPELRELNHHALLDPRVEVVNRDAMQWLDEGGGEPFDVVLIDFPDPNDYGVGKLYTTHFFRLLRDRMTAESRLGIQSTSPYFSPEAYWCIVRTLEHEGFVVRPYHAWVPSFGEWGFALASPSPVDGFGPFPQGLRFLTHETLEGMFHFPADMSRRDGPIHRLDNQVLVRLYEQDWQALVP